VVLGFLGRKIEEIGIEAPTGDNADMVPDRIEELRGAKARLATL